MPQSHPGGAQSSSSPGGPSSPPPMGRGMSLLAMMSMSGPVAAMGSSGRGMLSVGDSAWVTVEMPKVVMGTPILASLAVRFFCMCCWAAAMIAFISIAWGRGFLEIEQAEKLKSREMKEG